MIPNVIPQMMPTAAPVSGPRPISTIAQLTECGLVENNMSVLEFEEELKSRNCFLGGASGIFTSNYARPWPRRMEKCDTFQGEQRTEEGPRGVCL